MAIFLLNTQKIRDEFPDEFETVQLDDKTTLNRPKSSLKIKLDLVVEYNPLFFNFKMHILKDSYTVEWSKLDSEPYVIFNNWNRRNGYYISKKNVITNKGDIDGR
jgi:hypothetical protein